MGSIFRLLIATITVGLLLASIPCAANMSPMEMGLRGSGAATPKTPHSSIRLESEEVTIRLRADTYTVDAIFRFFNTGETITEWTGFPKRTGRSGATFVRFNTQANGKEIEFTEEPGNQPETKWLVHQITFPGHAKTTVHVGYEAPYYYSVSTNSRRAASYIYGTGSFWKDNIGKAVFIVDSSYLGGTKNVSTDIQSKVWPRRISENLVIYEIKDFKPDPGAELRIQAPGSFPPVK